MSHFPRNHKFPRMMMTHRSNGQFQVFSYNEILRRCVTADFVDCRINAYPIQTKWQKYNMVIYPADFLFIDIDLSNFLNYAEPALELDKAFANTLKDMEKLNCYPTALWTGNGYHIYQPIEGLILDNDETFNKDKFPYLFSLGSKYYNWSVSELFLKYVEFYLTSGKADPLHNTTFRSSLIRIPFTYNSKCLIKGKDKNLSQIQIVEKWNRQRPSMNFLLEGFRIWLTDLHIKEGKDIERNNSIQKFNGRRQNNKIYWIEKILQTPLSENRRYCLWRILPQYLMTTRKLSYSESFTILRGWLDKCNDLQPLPFNPNIEIKNKLSNVNGFHPISLKKLKEENIQLYSLLFDRR